MTDTETEFNKASEVKIEQTKKGIKERIQTMWGKLGDIKVVCPDCSTSQAVQTTKSTTCRKCGHSYKIYPKGSKSRVVWCPSDKLWILKNIRSLEVQGKYDEVL